MQETLIKKLHEYLRDNNPDLLMQLEENARVSAYLAAKVNGVEGLIKEYEGQPGYVIEETCMKVLTQDLPSSKFNYIRNILEEEFESDYEQFLSSGVLQFEVINIISHCREVFNTIGFTEESEHSRELHYAITGAVSEYLESREG